ncbi:MAG TPA: Flp family type IVb pilin [Tepidisphaeraceae bacterium]|jgi:Flp pilus assembly pilin Flp|nr:Flp family type IVb pilin [Tepidisphaeraceae bacterium]
MRRIKDTLRSIVRDESGTEIIEYALILGIISVASISMITVFGEKVLAKWTSIDSHSF